MKDTRRLRRLMNDPRICVLLPGGSGYRAISRATGASAGRMTVGDELEPLVLGDIWTGMNMDFATHAARWANSWIARIDVSHGSAMRLYDSVCAMQRAGVSGVVLESARNGSSSASGQDAQEIVRLVETLASVRLDPDFVIAARICAFGNEGYSTLTRRLKDCAVAGADLLFVDGSIPPYELRRLPEEVRKALCVDLSSLGQSPLSLVTSLLRDLQEMRAAAAVLPSMCHRGRRGTHPPAAPARRAFGSESRVRNRRWRSVTHRFRRIWPITEVKN